MHSALFVAISGANDISWQGLVNSIRAKTKPDEYTVRLADNVWLLNLRKSLSPLAALISLAEQFRIEYAILPFENAPQWLPAGSDVAAAPSQARVTSQWSTEATRMMR
jgi:hypothetical protein